MRLLPILEQLQGVKKYHTLTWNELVKKLEDNGIKSLGYGKFGQVFHKTGWKYVVKVFENDDAYLKYVNFCISHPNKHFPIFNKTPTSVHQFHIRPLDSNKMMQIVKVEILQKLTDLWYEDNLTDIYYFYRGITQSISLPKNYGDNTEIHYTDINRVFDDFQTRNIKSLIEAIDLIKQKLNFRLDLHSDNLMQRSDGTIVLSDPLYDESKTGGNINNRPLFQRGNNGWSAGPKFKDFEQLSMNFIADKLRL